jgi:hypothetical protein
VRQEQPQTISESDKVAMRAISAVTITAYLPKAPTTRVGLGIEIMDPRIGTPFPENVKTALEAQNFALFPT